VIVALLLVALLPGNVDVEASAAAELQRIQEAFRLDPHGSWQPDAERLVGRWPQAQAAGRACLWMGSLALEQGRYIAARSWFDETLRRFPDGNLATLAWRGRGDVDYKEGHYAAALAAYARARPDAQGSLALELDEKLRAARRERDRFVAELAAWTFALGSLVWLALALRGRTLRVPTETWALLPIYALLVLAAWRRDRQMTHALAYIAAGSLALVTTAFAGGPPRSRLRTALVLSLANLAVLYIALQRAGATSVTWATLLRSLATS
jgi:tetratricopeptide (TPR) repeat protein